MFLCGWVGVLTAKVASHLKMATLNPHFEGKPMVCVGSANTSHLLLPNDLNEDKNYQDIKTKVWRVADKKNDLHYFPNYHPNYQNITDPNCHNAQIEPVKISFIPDLA